MKKLLMAMMLLTSIVWCGEIEFDGGYLKTANGKYVEVKAKNVSTAKVVFDGVGIMQAMNMPKTYYITDKEGIATIAKKDFKGIAIKGQYDFSSFSFHPLQERKLQKGEGLFDNNGAASAEKPFYTNGTAIECNKKAIGSDGYYFEPKTKLESGDYVAWIGGNFWIFKIK
jgi:hypothetical protein